MRYAFQLGVSLLEMMLVLTIGITFVTMGIRFYNQFQFQTNEQKIAANVSQLFLALEGFYYANCRQALDINSNPQSSGSLDPAVTDTPSPRSNVILSVTGNLVGTGLFISPSNWQPNNPLLDNKPLPDQGYYVQFNRVLVSGNDPAMSVYACTGSTASPSCDVTSGAILASSNLPSAQSHAVMWVAQVAVKLSPTLTSTQWTQIQNDLSAACVSTAAGGGVAACTPTPAAGGYLVWSRTPSSSFNQNVPSDYWTTIPYVKEFNMQYTNDSMATLNGVQNETQNSTTLKKWYDPLYYLCGG